MTSLLEDSLLETIDNESIPCKTSIEFLTEAIQKYGAGLEIRHQRGLLKRPLALYQPLMMLG